MTTPSFKNDEHCDSGLDNDDAEDVSGGGAGDVSGGGGAAAAAYVYEEVGVVPDENAAVGVISLGDIVFTEHSHDKPIPKLPPQLEEIFARPEFPDSLDSKDSHWKPDLKDSPDSKYSQDSLDIKVSQDLPDIKVSQDCPDIKVSQDLPDIKVSQDLPDIKVTQDLPDIKVSQDCPDIKVSQDSLDVKDSKDSLDVKDSKDSLDLEVSHISLDIKTSQDCPDVKDSHRKPDSQNSQQRLDSAIVPPPELTPPPPPPQLTLPSPKIPPPPPLPPQQTLLPPTLTSPPTPQLTPTPSQLTLPPPTLPAPAPTSPAPPPEPQQLILSPPQPLPLAAAAAASTKETTPAPSTPPTASAELLAELQSRQAQKCPMEGDGGGSEWDGLEVVLQGPKPKAGVIYKEQTTDDVVPVDQGLTETPDFAFPQALVHFQGLDLSHLKDKIQMTVERKGLAALANFLFGPPKLTRQLVPSKEFVLCLAAAPLDNADPVQLKALMAINRNLTGRQHKCSRYGNHWEEIGFQGTDPATDLRAVGLLGLLQLLYLTSKPQLATLKTQIYSLAIHQTQNFPFCVMGLNVTKLVLQALRHGKLNKLCNKQGDVMSVVNHVYVAAYFKIFHIWKNQKKTILDSGFVLKEVELSLQKKASSLVKELEVYLKDDTSSLTIPTTTTASTSTIASRFSSKTKKTRGSQQSTEKLDNFTGVSDLINAAAAE
ncbi:hypothetical protein Ahia01_000864000 [Argonauta hians]